MQDKEGSDFVDAQQGSSVNPFLTQMFFRISFKAWHNLSMKKAYKEEMIALHGPSYGEKVFKEDKDTNFEEVTIELDPEIVEYTTDEENDASVADRKSGQGLDKFDKSDLDPDDNKSKQMDKSPVDHRRRVKAQKMYAARRFSSTYGMIGGSGIVN